MQIHAIVDSSFGVLDEVMQIHAIVDGSSGVSDVESSGVSGVTLLYVPQAAKNWLLRHQRKDLSSCASHTISFLLHYIKRSMSESCKRIQDEVQQF